MTDSIFAAIARGQQQAQIVLDEEQVMAILDINPASEGHTILFPKEPYQVLGQLPADLREALFRSLRDLRAATVRSDESITGLTSIIQQGAAAGQRAPHLLIHTVPRRSGGELNLPEATPTQEVERVRAALPETACRLEPLEPSRGLAEVRVVLDTADIFEQLDDEGIAGFASAISDTSSALFESLDTAGTVILIESGSGQEVLGAEARIIALAEGDASVTWDQRPAQGLDQLALQLRQQIGPNSVAAEQETNYLLDRLRRLP